MTEAYALFYFKPMCHSIAIIETTRRFDCFARLKPELSGPLGTALNRERISRPAQERHDGLATTPAQVNGSVSVTFSES